MKADKCGVSAHTFDISMHNACCVTLMESLEQLFHYALHLQDGYVRVWSRYQLPQIHFHIFKDENKLPL